ncbi:MAG TPA: hypothetical protein P5274_00240 [Candidatus Paceibacterota bacterium]|nr:hypothetical protein [Candidatus Paceibacterota bacterium]
MHIYNIQQKIKTLAKIEGHFFEEEGVTKAERTVDNITMRQWEYNQKDGEKGESWIAQAKIEAETFQKALNIFSEKLYDLFPRICFVSQCFLSSERETFLIFREDDNIEKNFIFVRFNDVLGGGLSMGKKEWEAIDNLGEYEYPQVFKFLQESINTPNYYSRMALLFATLEAMSGEVEGKSCSCPNGKSFKTYDKDKMKKILNDGELFNNLFGPDGLRHKLLHGNLKNFELPDNYSDRVYKSIIRYFNNTYGVSITEKATLTPRDFNIKNKLVLPLRMLGVSHRAPDLKKLIESFTNYDYSPGDKIDEFEVIKRPDFPFLVY